MRKRLPSKWLSLEWTDDDSAAAERSGWFLNCGKPVSIERYDVLGRFASDREAIDYVLNLAFSNRKGHARARKAVAIVVEDVGSL
jgi:hypothetical protein